MVSLRAPVRRLANCCLVAAAMLLSSACGGGGGADDGVTSATFGVTYDRDNVSIEFEAGQVAPEGVVQATAHGSPSGSVYLGADTPSGKPDSNIDHVQVDVQGTTGARVRVIVNSQLPAGTYTGTLVLLVCADPTCKRHYAGSPANLSYSITVRPNIVFSPDTLVLQSFVGEPVSATVHLTLPPDATSFAASSLAGWATIDQLTADSFRVTALASSASTFTAGIRVTAGSHSRMLTVRHEVPARQLVLDSAALALSAPSGQAANARVRVLSLNEYGQDGFKLGPPNLPWLTVSDTDATGFTVSTLSLPSGTYKAVIHVSSGTQTVDLPVTFTVSAPSGGDRMLDVAAKTGLTLAVAEGTSATPQPLGLQRPSWNPDVTASISYNSGLAATDWLTLTTGSDGDLLAQASALRLAPGVYLATITLTGAYPGKPVKVPVSMTVGRGLAVPLPQSVVLDSDSTGSVLSGSIPVVTNGVASGTWTATTVSPWVHLPQPSGPVGTSVPFEVKVADLRALLPYSDAISTVKIKVHASDAPVGQDLTPADAKLTLRRELAEVLTLGPALLLSGQPATLIVSGRGFDRLADPASHLSIGGVTPVDVERAGAASLKVTLPALAAGNFQVSMSNALGIATQPATLRVIDPQAYPAASFPADGTPVSVLHDAWHRQVFVANRRLSAVLRFRNQGSEWSARTLQMPGLVDIGLSPDGQWLLATTDSGRLYLVDPVGFSISWTYLMGVKPVAGSTGHGIGVTNDGKARFWAGTDGGRGMTFDLGTRVFADVATGSTTAFPNGSAIEVSRNGERVVMSSNRGGPSPLLYADISLPEWHDAPANVGALDAPLNGIDETGSRMMVAGKVYDADFALIGAVHVTAPGWSDNAAVLSPDGRRVYVVSLPSDWSDPAGTTLPRVFVFDASGPVGAAAQLPLLGSFGLAEYPTCRTALADGSCVKPIVNIAVDGRTLFIAGSVKVLVVPVPAVLDPAQASAAPREGIATLKRLR
ncbi:hypothetical protein [Rhizobacter sp. P5_C2]